MLILNHNTGTMIHKKFTLPNQTTLIIRDAVTEDAAQLINYLNRVGGESDFLTLGDNEFDKTIAEEIEFIERVNNAANSVMLVGEVDGLIVSVLNFSGGTRPRVQHAGEFGVSVLQSYWGLGIGSKMIETLIKWAHGTAIVRKISLYVRTDNVRAIKLYRKFGFVSEGLLRRELFINGHFYDTELMSLWLEA